MAPLPGGLPRLGGNPDAALVAAGLKASLPPSLEDGLTPSDSAGGIAAPFAYAWIS